MNELIIETQNLDFSYSKSRKDIDALNLKVPKGSIYGFLGPNGSGKTTTIRIILGLLKNKKGTVKLFNKEVNNNRIDCLSRVGVLIENPSLYGHLNAVDNLKITSNYRGNIPKSRIDEVIEIVKLSHAKHKKIKEYSLGMKQRLGVALALIGNPEILILDEPTNGLDPKGIIEMRELIIDLNKKYGTTIFVSSHLLSEIEKTCTHVGVIRKGKMLFQDTVQSLIDSQSDNLIIEIETDDAQKLQTTVGSLCLETVIISDTQLKLTIDSKETIPSLIDTSRTNSIAIYQINIKNNLEDLFLSLTENN